MNSEQIIGTIRQFLPFFSGIATALGLTWFDGLASAILATIGPLMALGSLVWSLVDKKQANVVARVAAMPEVKGIALNDTNAGRELQANTPPNVAVTPNAAARPL